MADILITMSLGYPEAPKGKAASNDANKHDQSGWTGARLLAVPIDTAVDIPNNNGPDNNGMDNNKLDDDVNGDDGGTVKTTDLCVISPPTTEVTPDFNSNLPSLSFR